MLTLIFNVLAQEAAPEEGAAPKPSSPTLAVLSFQDAILDEDQRQILDCPALEARYGDCLERVEFSGVDWLWEKQRSTPEQHSMLRNISSLYQGLWSGLSHRWRRPNDVVMTTLGVDGYLSPPPAAATWDSARPSKAGDRPSSGTIAVPDRSLWLDQGEWGLDERPGLFRPVQMAGPLVEKETTAETRKRCTDPADCPDITLLQGRFASRLGYDGRPYNYDLMDADPNFAGPFFEQVYPFRGPETAEGFILRPLAAFSASAERLEDVLQRLGGDTPLTTLPPGWRGTLQVSLNRGSWEEFVRASEDSFDRFYHQVGSDVLRYGMRDYTANQMRVFTSLSAMNVPPTDDGGSSGRSRNLVAAAKGQTDTAEALLSRTEGNAFVVEGIKDLRYESLPVDLVERWLALLIPAYGDLAFQQEWQQRATSAVRELLRKGAGEVPVQDPPQLEEWLRQNLSNNDPGPYYPEIMRTGLALLVQKKMTPAEQDRFQTWILLDQLSEAVASGLDPITLRNPEEIVKNSTEQWASTLSGHGSFARPVEQGINAVDPMAICTTLDAPAALKEPSISAVNLDIVVSATDVEIPVDLPPESRENWLAGQILWELREKLPFVLVDDPQSSLPRVTRLVGLPSVKAEGSTEETPQALFRIRWRVWAGWHLLWYPRDGRLGARTAPICEDMVLAPTPIVPTLVRAAMLSGELRPTRPVYRRDLKGKERWKPEKEEKSAEEAMGDLSAGAAGAQGAAGQAQGAAEVLSGPITPDAIGGLIKAPGAQEAFSLVAEPVSDGVRYLRQVVHRELWRKATQNQGLLLFTFDSTRGRKDLPGLGDLSPRTPYRRTIRHVRGGGRVATAAWATWWPIERREDPFGVAPAYKPGVSVSTEVEIPRWKRVTTQDWRMGGGLSLTPLRATWSACENKASDYDVVAPCPDPMEAVYSQALGFEMHAISTFWLLDQPRMGIEGGISVHLDIEPKGPSLAFPDQPVLFPTTLRPQGGLIVGFRVAPPPPGLWTGWKGSPWGADRSDGRSRLGRVEYGIRTGLLIGPGFNGLEGTAVLDGWLAASVRGKGPLSGLTPYHPSLLLGPYLGGQYSFLPVKPEEGTVHLSLDHSWSVVVGVRTEIRLSAPAKLPEAN